MTQPVNLPGFGPGPHHNPFSQFPIVLSCRHAESASNADKDARKETPSAAVKLTARGERQARSLAAFLLKQIHKNKWRHVLVVVTPMPRTHQTMQPFMDVMTRRFPHLWMREEADGLREIYSGPYPEGTDPPEGDIPASWEERDRLHERYARLGLVHLSPFYMGESAVTVHDRVLAWLTYKRDNPGHVHPDVIIICGHGRTGRVMRRCLTGESWQAYSRYKKLRNASVERLENGIYQGVVFCPSEQTY